MYEVELKVRAAHDPVRRRLEAVDAEAAGAVHQVDIYFQHPVRDFGETDEAFRLRRETRDGRRGSGATGNDEPNKGETDAGEPDKGETDTGETDDGQSSNGETGAGETDDGETDDGETTATVTYKGPLVEAASKTRPEYETVVGDGAAMERIVRELGFERFETVEKRRERYELDGYTVSLDAVEGLGEFVEVETDAETVEPAREGAVALLRDLGLDPDDQVRTSYLGLLAASPTE